MLFFKTGGNALTETSLNLIEEEIKKRLTVKKIVNMAICMAIFVLGILATIYKVKYEGGFLTCLREMTVDGTLFTSAIAFVYLLINAIELIKGREYQSSFLYFLRLSSSVAEVMILLIVLIGFLPIVTKDHPIIDRFDMINMHVIIPLLTIFSFVFHDAPIGKLKPIQRCNGLIFITIYAAAMLLCIFTGIVPENKIPYSFLNIYKSSAGYIAFAFFFVFTCGYFISWALSSLNIKADLLWFGGIVPKAKKAKRSADE